MWQCTMGNVVFPFVCSYEVWGTSDYIYRHATAQRGAYIIYLLKDINILKMSI